MREKVISIMKSMFKKIKNWVKLRIYEILYILLLIVLTSYIVVNWEKCITMKFFEQFDGNNILFLIWIVLIILLFYDIEAKGWKFRRKGIEDTRKQYEKVENIFMQNQIKNLRDNIQIQNSEEIEGVVVNDKLSK